MLYWSQMDRIITGLKMYFSKRDSTLGSIFKDRTMWTHFSIQRYTTIDRTLPCTSMKVPTFGLLVFLRTSSLLCRSIGGIILLRGNRSTQTKTCTRATLSTTNPTRTGLGSNSRLRDGKSATAWSMARPFQDWFAWTVHNITYLPRSELSLSVLRTHQSYCHMRK
jgi:hypothetical protein